MSKQNELEEVPKPSTAAQAPKVVDSLSTTKAQKEFLRPLLIRYNEKVSAMVQAHQEVAEISSTIYDFSTKIVAGEKKLKGQWFAIQPELVVRRDHPLAKQLQPAVWPPEEQ